jgi:hypothetical protein
VWRNHGNLAAGFMLERIGRAGRNSRQLKSAAAKIRLFANPFCLCLSI